LLLFSGLLNFALLKQERFASIAIVGAREGLSILAAAYRAGLENLDKSEGGLK
jgi:hypothetical protein